MELGPLKVHVFLEATRALEYTTLALPVLRLVEDGMRTTIDGSAIILLDQPLKEMLERYRNVRVIARRLHELFPDHRVRLRITRLPYDPVDGVKQRRVTAEPH